MKIHNHYYKLPLVAAATWFVTILVLLIVWLSTGRPHYDTQEGNVAFISDVGAGRMKPLFVLGAIITSLCFIATLVSERLLQHSNRLLPAQRKAEARLSYCAIGGSILGGLGLILLSGFDTMRYTTLHRIFLFVFMLGIVLSGIFTVVEYRLLSRSYDSYHKMRKSYVTKGIICAVLVALAVLFTTFLSLGRRVPAGYDAAGVLEWVIAFGFTLYLLTFWYDLRQAADKEDEHEQLKRIKALNNELSQI
ncbi:hypothetical protein FRC14_001248 [Serendipita sp. 396]|nr:hypothetical protein FRC14_001248 [Serendipita sp. 396]KAG8801213.1 hypothetical protein FRC16_001049 [Serendipita sp. 398]KAG8869920.1 hypothetical protein FRC20_000658 [Serendipita sp. 405]